MLKNLNFLKVSIITETKFPLYESNSFPQFLTKDQRHRKKLYKRNHNALASACTLLFEKSVPNMNQNLNAFPLLEKRKFNFTIFGIYEHTSQVH